MVKVIWHAAASPPHKDGSTVFVSCRQRTPHLNIAWPHTSLHPKQHLDRFCRFCTAHDCDRPTDRQTDRQTERPYATPSVAIGRIYVVLRCGRKRHAFSYLCVLISLQTWRKDCIQVLVTLSGQKKHTARNIVKDVSNSCEIVKR